ncbi:hypothetical protein ACQEU8_03765 [Streptomyces sp. CA-250714]|uniref:hypothetical protein n=1 Tax=Streptomyces sp. CA-250714 TaxID=3240060 RepID=UPI003D8D00BB
MVQPGPPRKLRGITHARELELARLLTSGPRSRSSPMPATKDWAPGQAARW